MISLVKTKIDGKLLVKIKGMGKITIDGFGGEQELLEYVLTAQTHLKEGDGPIVSYDFEKTGNEEWRVIKFSEEERILEVEQVKRQRKKNQKGDKK